LEVNVNSAAMGRYYAFTRRLFSSNHNVRNFKSNFAMNCSKFETKIPLDDPDADAVGEEPAV
jgi:Lrp/AsnC family leucine-responsive transcriptional regulator